MAQSKKNRFKKSFEKLFYRKMIKKRPIISLRVTLGRIICELFTDVEWEIPRLDVVVKERKADNRRTLACPVDECVREHECDKL